MRIKGMLALLLVLALLAMAGCGVAAPEDEEPTPPEPITLRFWVYDEGGWSEAAGKKLLSGLGEEWSHVTVEWKVLDDTDQATLSAAMEAGLGPDLLLGTVSQLQHARRNGAGTADVSGLMPDAYAPVRDACTDGGVVFAAPIAMEVTAMAVNLEVFRASGAVQYIDQENHTWTTEGFISAMKVLSSSLTIPQAAKVYCGGQNEDEGTRALVTNLYGGSITDETHTRYILNEQPTVDALQLLQKMNGMAFDDAITGDDENVLFRQQQLAMTFCWDSAQSEVENFTAFPMFYPTDQDHAVLPGEVWALGVTARDEDRADAALAVARHLLRSDEAYNALLSLTGHYPVKATDSDDVWAAFTAHMAPYEQDAPGWAIARSEWWQMLQRIGDGADVALEADTFCANANAAAAFAMGRK
ncbi:MAG: hypothetical protein IJQ46_03465 [Oscillospiraceae bacterium]|nr:hypothetical protein [Oscillospiraceae bacterium]